MFPGGFSAKMTAPFVGGCPRKKMDFLMPVYDNKRSLIRWEGRFFPGKPAGKKRAVENELRSGVATVAP